MKIVYISNSYIPSREANSMNVMNMCDAFHELGHEVILYAPDATFAVSNDIEDIYSYYGVSENIKIKKLWYPNISGKPFIYAGVVYRNLKRDKPDFIVGRSVHGIFSASLLKIPFTFDSHGPIWGAGKLAEYLFDKVMRSPSFLKLTTNSRSLRDIYVEKYPSIAPKISVAHNGAKEYDNSIVELPGQNKTKIGYFGHLYPGRGIELIIALASKFPNLDFIVVGGTEEDIVLRKQEVSNFTNLFFLGFVAPNKVYQYRNSCDVLLAPYQRDVMVARGRVNTAKYMNPIKLFEYLQSGKPIIASDMPAIREVLNNDNAILVNPEMIEEWENAIRQVLCHPEEMIRISTNAKNEFSNKYTWQARANKMLP